MTKIEKVVRAVSDLREFYEKLKKLKTRASRDLTSRGQNDTTGGVDARRFSRR